jgi:manganese-dependent inorganic pyrophosphatase
VVVTGNLALDPVTVEQARERGVNLLLSPHDSMTTALLCRMAIAVRHLLDEEFLHFRADLPLRAARSRAVESEQHAFPVLDDDDRVCGILSKSDFLKPVDRRLILVDHNELSQAVRGADQVEIIGVVDHHRIGALSTPTPIFFLNDPVGSTSTIVAGCFLRAGLELPRPVAGVLLAGLVADTLNLQSPTTTDRDAEVLRQLERLTGIHATDFAEQMFRTGSVLTSQPAAEAIAGDCKEYEENGCRFSVAQIEEIGFQRFWERKTEVVEALREYRIRHGYEFSALLVTDVACQDSLLLLAADESFLALIDYPELEPGLFQLNDVVSRKKQLLPYLTHCLQKRHA